MARSPDAGDDPVAIGTAYAHAVVRGDIPAGRYTRLACERFEHDKARADAGKGPWVFAPQFARWPCDFAHTMTHYKGPLAGRPLKLLPFQQWLLINIFGFVDRVTGARRFRQASVWEPRGQGKSTLAAILALCTTFLEGEGGAEGYTAAVTRDQARIVFDIAQRLAIQNRTLREKYGVQVRVNTLSQDVTASRLMAVSSDAKTLDGLNVHFACLDELASHRSKSVYDVVLTGMAKRRQPLMLTISTATDNAAGIGRQVWDYAVKVLEGQLEDEQFFGVIYAADTDDDVWDERTWAKANPGLGSMVQIDALRAIARQAQAAPALKAAFMTRHLNLWVSTDSALFDLAYWDRCAAPDTRIDQYAGLPCFAALDMATRVDLAAISLVFPFAYDGEEILRYAIFHQVFLPPAGVNADRNPAYVSWAERGWLTVTEGETTDYAAIEDALRGFCKQFNVRAIAHDPYALMQLSQRLRNEGLPMIEYRATTLNFSEPTLPMHQRATGEPSCSSRPSRIRASRSFVVGHYDARSNVYPRKARAENKIDCAIASIMALGTSLTADAGRGYYDTPGRELLVF
jgi:phage terminase large subunit-like protein